MQDTLRERKRIEYPPLNANSSKNSFMQSSLLNEDNNNKLHLYVNSNYRLNNYGCHESEKNTIIRGCCIS